MRLLVSFSLAASILILATTAHACPPSLKVETIVLPNGLRVVLAPDSESRMVSLRVQYFAGSGDDPDGKRALAHLSEHMMFRASPNIPAPMAFFSSRGVAEFQGTTAEDVTTYDETCMPEQLPSMLWLEATRMAYRTGALTPKMVEEELHVVENESTEHGADRTGSMAAAAITAELVPPWHPYYPPWGNGDIARLTLPDVRAFIDSWYAPSNAVVVVAGRFQRDEVVQTIRTLFGAIPDHPVPRRPSLPPFEVRAGRVDVAVPVLAYEVALAWPIARVSASERAALDLVGLILTAPGELLGRSPFTPETVQQVDFWSSYSRDGSSVRLWATFDRPENLQTVLTAVHLALSHLTTKLTDGDVQRLRRRWADARTLALGDVRVRAAMLARAVATGTIPDAQYDWDFGEHDRLTAVDIRGAAARLVPDARAVLVVAYPDEAAPIRGMVFRRIDEEAPSE